MMPTVTILHDSSFQTLWGGKDGLIQQVGSPLELYNAPSNMFVAGFIGSPAMNFFEAELARSGDLLFLQTDSFRIDLPPEKSALTKGYPEKKVIVSIQPEDLMEAKEHVAGKTIQTTVEVVEPIGSEMYLNVSAGECTLTASVDRKTQVKSHQDFILEPLSGLSPSLRHPKRKRPVVGYAGPIKRLRFSSLRGN